MKIKMLKIMKMFMKFSKIFKVDINIPILTSTVILRFHINYINIYKS